MRYTRIRFDKVTVSLAWEEKQGDVVDKHDWSCKELPTSANLEDSTNALPEPECVKRDTQLPIKAGA